MYTPMLQQYLDIKNNNKDAILFFRMGDFYEMFFEDALTASKALDITLTSRDGGKGKKVPMCGVPHHAYETYSAKLIRQGFKVAICEQVEDPKVAKGIVKREVVNRITPGTVMSDNMLDSKKNNYLTSVYIENNKIGFAFLDISTGEFKTTEFQDETLFISEFSRVCPSECIIPSTINLPERLKAFIQTNNILKNNFDDWMCSYESSHSTLIDLFKTHSLDGFGLTNLKLATIASGIIIIYLKQLKGKPLNHINGITVYHSSQYMVLDAVTQKNLELDLLIQVIDQTITSLGGRLLRKWLLQPLADVQQINNRQDYVQELKHLNNERRDLRILLKEIADMERIISRINAHSANPRDLVALSNSITTIEKIKHQQPDSHQTFNKIHKLCNSLPNLTNITDLIIQTIVSEPPLSTKDGGMINPGINEELDELRTIKTDGKTWLRTLQETEIKRTGVKSLKVKYNKVFGYYIEITKSNLNMVPDDYIRKQTLVNAERFITPDLKEKEALILGADEKLCRLEQQIFMDLILNLIQYTPEIQKTAAIIAQLDVFQGFAETAVQNNYTRPEINNTGELNIQNGRHPVVESLKKDEKFIPNNTELSTTSTQIAIITGPNMSGKSTYIRQTALLVLMAQIGSYIPADIATIGIVDRIFTRVGAADELIKGQSTFMLEMNETSNILHNATNRSLLILDEVGRGTSTFDGVSIAWAIAEYIHDKLGARTLFATHYHELTELETTHERITNYRVACKEWQDEVIFLHKIEQGGTDKSYGIHVARLAGIPREVITRAREIEALQTGMDKKTFHTIGNGHIAVGKGQAPYNTQKCENNKISEKLKTIDPNKITPLQALEIIMELKQLN